jgi:hypothetical protein
MPTPTYPITYPVGTKFRVITQRDRPSDISISGFCVHNFAIGDVVELYHPRDIRVKDEDTSFTVKGPYKRHGKLVKTDRGEEQTMTQCLYAYDVEPLYKVGDRVVVGKNNIDSISDEGRTGTIEDVDSEYRCPYYVRFDGDGLHLWCTVTGYDPKESDNNAIPVAPPLPTPYHFGESFEVSTYTHPIHGIDPNVMFVMNAMAPSAELKLKALSYFPNHFDMYVDGKLVQSKENFPVITFKRKKK